jgi:hypothetical protein
MTYSLSKKTVLAVATETTPGTAPATPTLYVPTKHTYKRMVKHQYITDDRATRDDNNDVVQLVLEGNHSLKGEFYNDTSPYFILGALGLDTPSQPDAGGAPTAWQHIMTPADIPPTLTLYKSYQAAKYQMPFSVVEKFSFKLQNQGTLQFDADLVSNGHMAYAGTWTPAISPVHPMSGAKAVIKVGGATSVDIDDIEIDFSQKFTFWYSGLNAVTGNADYIAAYPGGRDVKFKFTARFDTSTIYDKFVSETLDSLEFSIQGPLIAASTYQSVDVVLPVTHYDTGEHDTSKENVTVKMAGTAIPSGAELISVTTVNTIASYAS